VASDGARDPSVLDEYEAGFGVHRELDLGDGLKIGEDYPGVLGVGRKGYEGELQIGYSPLPPWFLKVVIQEF